jgi:predicted DNA-binding protein
MYSASRDRESVDSSRLLNKELITRPQRLHYNSIDVTQPSAGYADNAIGGTIEEVSDFEAAIGRISKENI